MSFDSEQLRTLIQQAACGTINEEHLSKLVQIARVMCEAHLRYARPSALRFAANQGVTTTELVYDCLGEAFARDTTGRFRCIQNLVEALHAPLDEIAGEELLAAMRGSIARLTDRYLAQLYALNDPTGTRIKRNIRNALKNKDSCMSLSRDLRGVVLQPAHENPLDEHEPFPLDTLEQLFLQRARYFHTVPELLDIVHAIVTEQSVYRRSLVLNDIVNLFKLVYVEREESADDETTVDFEGLSDADVSRILLQVQRTLQERIVVTYLTKGKIDRRQAEGIFLALCEMMKDWAFGRRSVGLFEYARRHLDVSEKEYHDTLRPKMEYLLRETRNELAARLRAEL